MEIITDQQKLVIDNDMEEKRKLKEEVRSKISLLSGKSTIPTFWGPTLFIDTIDFFFFYFYGILNDFQGFPNIAVFYNLCVYFIVPSVWYEDVHLFGYNFLIFQSY